MPLGKFSFSLSKFLEAGLILVIIGLGILLAVFGGSTQRPKLERGPDGAPRRVIETTATGERKPAFIQVNKFFNAQTLTQIAKDTSFFAIMAISMTLVIIILGIDLSVGSMYALSAV